MLCNQLVEKSLRSIGVLTAGETLSAEDAHTGFEAANDMIDAWAAQRLTIYNNSRHAYPIVTGQGTPDLPYLIGPGAQLDQPRPLWISDAACAVLNAPNPYEFPLHVLIVDSYARTSIKTLTSSLPTDLYYNPRFDQTGPNAGYGEIFLYPIPNGGQEIGLVLYCPEPMTGFADEADTDYLFPPGYAEALRYQLALRLWPEYFGTKTISANVAELAKLTFGLIQKPNLRMPHLRVDRGMPGLGGGFYNWRTGTNDRRGD